MEISQFNPAQIDEVARMAASVWGKEQADFLENTLLEGGRFFGKPGTGIAACPGRKYLCGINLNHKREVWAFFHLQKSTIFVFEL